jgi:ATP-dependent exoDNAse (exonuclease V) beta subunit
MGATLGSAVHRALELVDLATDDDVEVVRCAEAACAELGVPRFATDVAARVRTALAAPIVMAAAKGRHWKEVSVVADLDGRIVEGTIDLLFETSRGLVVVDYKTDVVATPEAKAQKLAHYTPQLSAYTRAVASAAALPVAESVLCFIGPNGAYEARVEM